MITQRSECAMISQRNNCDVRNYAVPFIGPPEPLMGNIGKRYDGAVQ
jgi:hypothetical protein